MRRACPLIWRQTAAADVLSCIVECHKQQLRVDPEAEDDVALTMTSPVAEWRRACDLVGTRKLGRALNTNWRMSVSDTAWKAVLEPAQTRTLADVCTFIAERTLWPELAAGGYLGPKGTAPGALAAAAFLGARACLEGWGIDVRAIRPSTRLDQLPGAAWHLVRFAAQVAPNRLPLVTPEYKFLFFRQRLRLGGLATFRDYAECLAGVAAAGGRAPPGS
jgi:hypothetical protein